MSSLRDIERTLTSIWMEKQPVESAQSLSCILEGEKFDEDGARLYARLIGYGHSDVLGSIYPYCQKVLNRSWENTLKRYVQTFPPDHFHLNSSARKFPQFLKNNSPELMQKFPYLAELADYEWLEMELMEVDTAISVTEKTPLTDPQSFVSLGPLVNQTLQVRTYEFPIQEIVDLIENGKGFRKKFRPKESHVAMYRDPLSHRVRIVDIDDNARILLAEAGKSSYGDLIRRAVELNPDRAPEATVTDVIELVEYFHEINLFVGERNIGA